MASASTNSLVDALRQFRLLEPVQLEEVTSSLLARFPEAKALAGELIQRGWLTPFQANQLLQGRGQGLVLGAYVLLERLGKGGMGQVFKARHTLMKRIVALKVIRADRLDRPEALGRFRQEMEAAAKLAHANVVFAHDAALVEEGYLLAMEYVEGIDLARLLKQSGRLPPALASAYVRQAALGLQHAHERGLVHRDVKPSNLILAGRQGVVKILDLGLALLGPDRERGIADAALTGEGAVMGTPDYIAPEQALNSHTVDIRADVYSLGCTLYHLLTGQPPFPGGSLTEKVLKHQQAEPEPVEHLCPDMPPDLALVIRKMMAKRPRDRHQTPRGVAEALAPFTSQGAENASESPAQATPMIATTDWSRTPSSFTPRASSGSAWLPRNRVVRLAAVIVAVVIPLLVVLALSSRRPGTNARESPGVRDERPAVRNEPIPLIPDRVHKEKAPPPLDQQFAADPQGDRPSEAAQLPPLPANGRPRLVAELKGHTGKILDLSFNPESRRMASAGDDNQVRLWDARTGEKQGAPLGHSAPVRALGWSPTGKYLASGSWDGGYEASVKVWDLAGSRESRTFIWKDETGTPSLADVRGVAFSPDGKWLASGGGPLRLWDLIRDGEPAVLNWQKSFPSYLYGVAFAPAGKRVAAGCHELGDTVRLWEVGASGDPILLRGNNQAFGLSHSDVHGMVTFAAGGKLLVRVTSDGLGFGKGTGSVKVWDVGPGQQLSLHETYKIPGGAVFALVHAADGHLRVGVSAGEPHLRPGLEAVSDEVNLWDSVTRQVQAFNTGHKQNITALAFSSDGTRLATGSADQAVRLWDLSP